MIGSGLGSGSINIDEYPESFDESDDALPPLSREDPSLGVGVSDGCELTTFYSRLAQCQMGLLET